MHEIDTSIEIDAPAERVWEVLTRFSEFDDWNPVITRMRAGLAAGADVSFLIRIDGRKIPIQARMLKVEAGREIRWKGPRSDLLAKLVAAEHFLRVEPRSDGRSVFIHGERFTGVLLKYLWGFAEPRILAAYGVMNRAVKARAEQSAH